MYTYLNLVRYVHKYLGEKNNKINSSEQQQIKSNVNKFFFNWDLLHASLKATTRHGVTRKETQKRLQDTWAYGRFIEIQNNLRRKKLHRTN